MAKELQSISLGAAGFLGVNSMDPPLQQSLDFADTANNAVIDNYGRLGARKGCYRLTPSNLVYLLNGELVHNQCHWISSAGVEYLFTMGNGGIYITTITDATTAAQFDLMANPNPVTTDDWQTADFNGATYFFQDGYAPVMIDDTLVLTPALATVDSQSGDAVPAAPTGGAVIAAYGRLWATGSDKSTVYWSSSLDGTSWTEGDSGSIDLTTVWPNGYDEVVGFAAHNERIIFFGRNSIVVYTGAVDPATMELEDAVAGTGCAFKRSIVHTGDDVLFCSYTGIKSLGRTVLQNSLPSNDVTKNVRNLIQESIRNTDGPVNAVYSPEESFYLITFGDVNKTYCIDLKETLPDQSRKITIWPGSPFTAWCRSPAGILYCGSDQAVGRYYEYTDNEEGYRFQYFGPALDFGDASRVKVMKKMIATMVGGLGREATFSWGHGYAGAYRSQVLTLDDSLVAEYGIAEYNAGFEFSGGSTTTDEYVNTTGSGEVIRVGVGVSVNGSAFSLQQLRVHVIMGKIV